MRPMLLLVHRPAPPLDSFVDYLWLMGDAPPHEKERVLPSGTLELVINLHENEIRIYDAVRPDSCRRLSGATVSGAYRGSFVIDTRVHASMIGVHFKPGGASSFLGVPSHELADAHVELEALWSRHETALLRERLCAEPSPDIRFRILEEALLAHLRRPLQRQLMIQAALDHLRRPRVAVSEVADFVGLSHRRFIESFSAEVGMTPKMFLRVWRFQRVLAQVARRSGPDWAEVALECGYFDQSHLIRDFVAFSGITPVAYLRHRSARVKDHHLLLLQEGSNSSNTAGRRPGRLRATGGGSHASRIPER